MAWYANRPWLLATAMACAPLANAPEAFSLFLLSGAAYFPNRFGAPEG